MIHLSRNILSITENLLFLLSTGGYTTATIPSQNFFYIFDSHSRDERGLNNCKWDIYLLKFIHIFEIEKYIQVAYFKYRDQQKLYSKRLTRMRLLHISMPT